MLPLADFLDREHRRSGQLRLFIADLMEGSSDVLELSLKLYHAGELQLARQQLMAEAPPYVESWPRNFQDRIAGALLLQNLPKKPHSTSKTNDHRHVPMKP